MLKYLLGHINRTLFITLLLAALPAMAFIVVNERDRLQQGINEAQDRAVTVVHSIAAQHVLVLDNTRTLLSILAQTEALRTNDHSALDGVLHNLL